MEKENKRKDGLTMSFSDQSKRKIELDARLLGRQTHKEFIIDGITVVALNKKNASRKIEKLKKDNQ
jgi:hypothetical protein